MPRSATETVMLSAVEAESLMLPQTGISMMREKHGSCGSPTLLVWDAEGSESMEYVWPRYCVVVVVGMGVESCMTAPRMLLRFTTSCCAEEASVMSESTNSMKRCLIG